MMYGSSNGSKCFEEPPRFVMIFYETKLRGAYEIHLEPNRLMKNAS